MAVAGEHACKQPFEVSQHLLQGLGPFGVAAEGEADGSGAHRVPLDRKRQLKRRP